MKEQNYYRQKRFLVTGGAGFLGRHVVEELQRKGAKEIVVPRSAQYDLTREMEVRQLFEERGPIDVVLHLAAVAGGIGFNRHYPADVFYNNIMMNSLVMEHARRSGVQKFVGIGSVCEYPKYTEVPFSESSLWNGYPEETNAPYGLAKKMMLVQGQAYRQQYNFQYIHLLMINLYGPSDNFHPEHSHVIPGLIGKFVDAKHQGSKKVIAWGTGEATREFLYVEDAAEGIVLATERYDKPDPVNLGTGQEIKVMDLVYLIKDLSGFKGDVEWDTSKPDGQPRRQLDTSRAKKEFGFEAKTDFRAGLRRTIEWYEEQREFIPAHKAGHSSRFS